MRGADWGLKPMTTGGYGQMRATDADRDSIHTMLQAAYADGRLTWDEFDARSTALMAAKTFGELAPLTADLRMPVPYQPPARIQGGTNQLAIIALICGLLQFPFWFAAGIPAIVCGHIARRQIRQTGQQGSGMAVTGLVLGYLGVVGPILLVLLAALIAGNS
jgi:hypothetical protein